MQRRYDRSSDITRLRAHYRDRPYEFKHCCSYIWHCTLTSKLGCGSFGSVYFGFHELEGFEVAVKEIPRELFARDDKVKINLQREVEIQQLLSYCPYVVNLYHVEELAAGIVMIMEFCDTDLEQYLKTHKFTENQIKSFLKQLSIGVKAMHDQGIVHRDLKPQNILMKIYHNDIFEIKIADFGYSRHYLKGEGTKNFIDMNSVAGTPVFMAPEALYCVIMPGGHYDHTVDMWSVGALLYRVLVGKCGFFLFCEKGLPGTIQKVIPILKSKGDAIAFEIQRNSRPHYIYELPSIVDAMVSESMKNQLNKILKELLKVDPAHRMTVNQFYTFVDDLVQTNLEMVDVLNGRSCKIPLESNVNLETLRFEVTQSLGITNENQILLCDSPASKSKLRTQEDLIFFLRCSTKTLGPIIIYVIDKSIILGNSTLNILFPSLSELSDLLSKCDTVKRNVNGQLKTQDMSLPNICVSVVKDMGKNQELQMKALQSFAYFMSTSQESYEVAKNRFETNFKVLEAKVSFLADSVLMDLENLKSNQQYNQQVDNLTSLCHTLKHLLREAQTPVASLEEEFKRLNRSLQKEVDKCLETECFKEYQLIHAQAQKVQYFSPPYLQRVREMVEVIINSYTEFLLKIQNRLQISFSLMNEISSLTSQLNILSDNLTSLYTRKLLEVQTRWRQEIHNLLGRDSICQSPESPGDETLTLHKRRANLQQQLEYKNRENAKLLDKCEKLKCQLKKTESRALSAEELVSQKTELLQDNEQIDMFYSCMKLIQSVCPSASSPDGSSNLELDFNGLCLKEVLVTPVQKLQESLRDLSHIDINKLREQLERRLESKAEPDSNGLISVVNFKIGDFVLFLPTKHQPGYHAVPQAFTSSQDTVYLDKACYKSFGLPENEPLRSWLIGRCTSNPKLEPMGPNCPYPAGKSKQGFYTIQAQTTEYVSSEPRRRSSSRNLNVPVKN